MKTLAWAVLLLTLTVCKRTAAQSGMPEELKELLKQALSEAAGLDADNLEDRLPKQQQGAVPQFMLDMYDCWNTIDDDNETNVLQHCRRAIVDEEEEELPKIVQEADTILTFLHEGMIQHTLVRANFRGFVASSALEHSLGHSSYLHLQGT